MGAKASAWVISISVSLASSSMAMKGHDQQRHALAGVEQFGELDEALALQPAQQQAYVSRAPTAPRG